MRLARIDLALQVLIGLVAGLVTGLFLGELAAPLNFVGTAFIRLLQITVIPYIMVALITGLGRLEIVEIGKLARSGGGVLGLLWLLGICLVLAMPLAYPDWPQRSLFQKSSLEAGTPVDFLLLFIPSNPFHAMANAIVPAVVVFSIFIGLALTVTPRRELIIDPLLVLGDTLSKVTGVVSRLSPIGVFALVAALAGTVSAEDLFRLQVHVVVSAALAVITALWLLPAVVSSVTPLRHLEMLRALRAPMLTAFATGSTLVVLPMLADACKRLIEASVSERPRLLSQDEADEEREVQSSVDVLIPTFYSFPTIGNVLALGFIVFGGWYIGTPIEVSQYAVMILGGIASLFGGTAISIPFTLDLVDLPPSLFSVFLSIDFVGSRLSSLVGVMHYATIALIGTFALQNQIWFRFPVLFKTLLPGVLIAIALLLGFRLVYSNYIVVPYTAADVLSEARLLGPETDAVVHIGEPEASSPGAPRPYEDIATSGTIRICYIPGNYPLSFFNSDNQLVGFDIEMALRFAQRSRLTPEFLPLGRIDTAAAKLDSGYCDAVFNSTAVSLDRTAETLQSEPVGIATLALVVPDERRKAVETWSKILETDGLTLAVGSYHAFPRAAETNLPDVDFVSLEDLEAQRSYFESGGAGADAFIDTAEEGAAWTLLYPRFSVVVPRPVTRVPMVYLTSKQSPLVLKALNTWLLIERESGGIEELEQYWIEGRRDAVAEPRWSVIRDVLGWAN
ncbi:cation:dicarboxylate symporter family transporter [Roseibium sp.]|uniref:cation:dicarboxylate symporter family transporter n=1 Tax=Roseibium sp. TaxID=1936156 RepID=UPI003BAEABDC